ncbi:MAG: RsmB/NOP family class I SAM-dependent RNA methyltransferase [Nanoarchaeota archaeon]|nr:RsmB/NOP family class I SAM-dependent RNA methyltransferase [Nanoarchaeota archaeon]
MNQFIKRYRQICPDFSEVQAIHHAIRVNTLKITEKNLVERLNKKRITLEKIPFVKHGYFAKARFSLASVPEYLQGYYYIQEAASQVPAEILDPKPTDTVLDMCAAPGSKLTHLAQLMQNKGCIIGLDIEDKRLEAVRNNVARLGMTNILLYKKDAKQALDLGMKFDKILLDAPCSGNYCTERNWFKRRKVKDFENRAILQKQLLKAGVSVLKPRGELVYSTCSLEPEENEVVVDWALKKYNLKLAKINLSVGDSGITNPFGKRLSSEIKNCIRFWPHKTGTQGFFIAKFVFKGTA